VSAHNFLVPEPLANVIFCVFVAVFSNEDGLRRGREQELLMIYGREFADI
jgi:hypothetical protein